MTVQKVSLRTEGLPGISCFQGAKSYPYGNNLKQVNILNKGIALFGIKKMEKTCKII